MGGVLSSEIEKLIALERLQGLYNDSRVVSFGAVVTATLMGLMLWSSQSQQLVIVWIVAHIFISIVRGSLLYHLFRYKIDTLEGALIWVKLYALVALVSGLLWGSLPITVFDSASTYNVSAIVIVMFGMTAASNVALSAYPAAFFCFALPSLGGLFIRLMSEGGDFMYVGMMLIAFIFFSLVQSIRIYRMITLSIRQRFENNELMRNLEIKKQEADKISLDKSRFLAATSHDLRQPLHALHLYLGALKISLVENTHKEILEKAQKSSQSVGELLNALLDISRLDAGEVQANIREIYLPSLLKDIQSEWLPQFEEEGRTLRIFSIQACLLTDPVLLSRMLGNILANALRHTDGDVLLGARRRHGQVHLEVCDQGKGIPADALEHVFTEYFQLNNPERDRTKGLGLGLAIVKRLSLLLDHPIHLQSFPDKGLCFVIEVPMIQSHESHISAAEQNNDNSMVEELEGFVLVIDDEESIRDGLQLLLRAWGCEVLISDSGNSAVEEMQRDQYPVPDAIIADYRLREGELGLDAVSDVIQLFGKDIPALIVTGDMHAAISKSCEQLGYTLLHKPLSSKELYRSLRRLLSPV